MINESTLSPTNTDLILLTRNRRTIGVAAIMSALLFFYLITNYGWRQGALFVVGLATGVILYHAAFGFTSAWREVVDTGRGAGLRAQMIMLAVTVLAFTPLIAQGEIFGMGVRGSVAPLNVAVICGAFMFVGLHHIFKVATSYIHDAAEGKPKWLNYTSSLEDRKSTRLNSSHT